MYPVKLSDIAREAGVSVSTVTRCLNRSGYVSREKAERVEKAAKSLGYLPNLTAQTLKGGRSNLIGHIVPTSFHNPYFSLLSEEVNREALARGCHVITMVIGDVCSELIPLLEQMRARMVDGILLSSFLQVEMTEDIVRYLDHIGIPLAMVERSAECFGIDKVVINNTEGTYLATRHLIESGHREIAYIGKEPVFPVEQERLRGFVMAMEEQGLELPSNWRLFVDEYGVDRGVRAAEKLLRQENLPTAVLIASDILAAGALQCFLSRGIRVPEELSVIGHDNTLAPYLSPPLTSVSLPVRELARCALDLVLEKSEGGTDPAKAISVSPELVKRNSVFIMK